MPSYLDKDPTLDQPTRHEAGCIYGGMACGYWVVADGCPEDHWERHYVMEDGKCSCGHTWPGAQSEVVFYRLEDDA